MITQEHTQEALSTAYVHALAGLAGLNLAARSIFDYGVDGTFRPVKFIGQRRIENGHPVDFQMKATTLWAREDDNIIYDLDVKAYNWLTERERGMPMAILILLCMPKDSNEWLEVEEQHLRLRHCCYWYRDSGPRTKNKSTVRIKVPRTNILTPESLQGIMATARQEALR